MCGDSERKLTEVASPPPKKRKKIGPFSCSICLEHFGSRNELFKHKVADHQSPEAWTTTNVDPDFQDSRLNAIIRRHSAIISVPHTIEDDISVFNFPLLMRVGSDTWHQEISTALERVSEVNSQEAYKVNFSMGFILLNKETEEYRFFAAGFNNSFFKEPKRIDRSNDWSDIDISQEALVRYILHSRESTKWIPLMLTNVVITLYHLGVTMGEGSLPDYIVNHNCIVGLATSGSDRTVKMFLNL